MRSDPRSMREASRATLVPCVTTRKVDVGVRFVQRALWSAGHRRGTGSFAKSLPRLPHRVEGELVGYELVERNHDDLRNFVNVELSTSKLG